MERCKNCHSLLTGRFCSNCGQKRYTNKDKSVKHLVHEAFHFITHFEGKFFQTLKAIFRYPGKLSVEYCHGIRQKYYKPVSFYLMIVILYLLFPLFSGLNMEMKYYKNLEISGTYISRQIDNKKKAENITEERLAELFHQKSKSTSKILLLLLIPLTSLILYILYFYKKPQLFDNIILSTEINIFYLLTFYILFPIIIYGIIYISELQPKEKTIGFLLTGAFVVYSIILLRNVFKEKWWLSLLKGMLLALLHTLMLYVVYKTLVFEVTFALI